MLPGSSSPFAILIFHILMWSSAKHCASEIRTKLGMRPFTLFMVLQNQSKSSSSIASAIRVRPGSPRRRACCLFGAPSSSTPLAIFFSRQSIALVTRLFSANRLFLVVVVVGELFYCELGKPSLLHACTEATYNANNQLTVETHCARLCYALSMNPCTRGEHELRETVLRKTVLRNVLQRTTSS